MLISQWTRSTLFRHGQVEDFPARSPSSGCFCRSPLTSMSQPDPFGFKAQCGPWDDTQLMTNTFANAVDAKFTFRCCGGLGCADQTGPTFQSCSDTSFRLGNYNFFTFCIGGIGEQHACAGTHCQQISWVNTAKSSPCAQPLLDFMKIQPSGAQYACCDATSCTPGTDYACAGSRSLQLCVTDGGGAECVNPANNAICSGNYTSVTVVPPGPSSTSSTGLSPTSPINYASTTQSRSVSSDTSSLLPSSSAAHSRLSASDVATVIGSTIGGVTSILGVGLAIWKYKKEKKKKAEPDEKFGERF
ncbi:hypothetical protein LshimejAT787_0201030 [Lyophyllum shimeji]|uniref:Uncharacterized protein n=1 Tax=Lyophyllum shimeji TaxID=47721 RepID=A0A9P3UIK8_LYOSH|nr:hypothetical protein LshimejAT787_0201030 [Lyophyllum shimeji]